MWYPVSADDIGLNELSHFQELGMWIVDGDFSCIAVVCHKSQHM